VTGFSSTFIFAILTRPAYCVASWSRTGESIRQYPHQGAWNSRSTGPGKSRTSRCHDPSETSTA
jgi:hypothetical protein